MHISYLDSSLDDGLSKEQGRSKGGKGDHEESAHDAGEIKQRIGNLQKHNQDEPLHQRGTDASSKMPKKPRCETML